MLYRYMLFLSLLSSVTYISGCSSYNQNELLSDSTKIASCPPGCASQIIAKPDQLMVQLDSGSYSAVVGADHRIDVTGRCYSPYASHAIYLQISTSIPSTGTNAKLTDYIDLNTGVSNAISCVAGKFAASVRLGALTAPAGYYMTAIIRGTENGKTLDNLGSGGLSYIPFTVVN